MSGVSVDRIAANQNVHTDHVMQSLSGQVLEFVDINSGEF